MRWRGAAVAVLLMAGGCGSSRTVCEAGGRTYRPGESYPLDCNTCVCMEDGTFACTGLGCFDGGSDGGADAAVDAARDAGGPACAMGGTSNLEGVSIDFPEQQCVFTLAEAAAAISITYRVLVETPVTAVTTRPQDSGGCGTAGDSGLILFEELDGGGQHYCLCDTGLCPGADVTSDLMTGYWTTAFPWTGRNWNGPSDTGTAMGEPFPPGSYTLTVSSVGEHAGAPIRIEGTFTIHLVP